MELETLKQAVELDKVRTALTNRVKEIKETMDVVTEKGGKIVVERITGGTLLHTSDQDAILRLLNYLLKDTLHRLSKVELEILNLDEPVQETPTPTAESDNRE